jgi:hypothetical protein
MVSPWLVIGVILLLSVSRFMRDLGRPLMTGCDLTAWVAAAIARA